MNDKEELLWNTMDGIRGEIPLPEQKIYLLPMMTLAVIEIKEETFNIPKAARWSEIIRSGKGIGEKLSYAFNQLEEENRNLRNVFKDISFTKVNDATLHKLALQIDHLPLKENSGEIADRLLFQSAAYEGRGESYYITPPYIAKLIVHLLDIKDGSSVSDSTAGTGQFLNQASKSANHLSLYGQETNQQIWRLAKMNAILHGNEEMDLRLGDTIRSPQFGNEDGLQTYDYVMMDPPYGLNNWGYEEAREDIFGRFFYGLPPKSRGDMAFVLHALASLNNNGKAAVIVPHGVLFRGATEGKIRQKLMEQDVIEAVIGLPPGLLYSTAIPVAILILNKNKSQDRKHGVFFINAEEEFEQFRNEKVLGETNIKKITEVFKTGEEIERFSQWVPLEEMKDDSLHIQTYFEEDRVDSLIGKVQVNKNNYEQMNTEKLKSVGELFRGMNTPSANKMESDEPTHLIIELSDVQEGQILIDSLTPVSMKDNRNTERYELKSGDIILSSRGTAIKIALIPETSAYPLLVSNHFIAIRPNQDINPIFLKAFLESPVGMFYLTNSQKGSMVSVLTVKDIQDIPIPKVPYEDQSDIAEGFIQSNDAYIKQMKEAKEKYQAEYEHLYNKMGLDTAYKKMD